MSATAERATAGESGLSGADAIIDAAAEQYRVKRSCILSERQDAPVVEARHLALYRCRNELLWSYPRIGRLFDRDHTTVMNACRKVERLSCGGQELALHSSTPG